MPHTYTQHLSVSLQN